MSIRDNIIRDLRATRAWLAEWVEQLESGRVKLTRDGEDETEAQAADAKWRLGNLDALIAAYDKQAQA